MSSHPISCLKHQIVKKCPETKEMLISLILVRKSSKIGKKLGKYVITPN